MCGGKSDTLTTTPRQTAQIVALKARLGHLGHVVESDSDQSEDDASPLCEHRRLGATPVALAKQKKKKRAYAEISPPLKGRRLSTAAKKRIQGGGAEVPTERNASSSSSASSSPSETKKTKKEGTADADEAAEVDYKGFYNLSAETSKKLHFVAGSIMRLVYANDRACGCGAADPESRAAPLTSGSRAFVGRRVPKINLVEYLHRVVSAFVPAPGAAASSKSDGFVGEELGLKCLVMGVIYNDRAVREDATFLATSWSIHRLVIAGVALGAKYLSDRPFSNKYFAEVGGVAVKELNTLEIAFCKQLGYRLFVDPREAEMYELFFAGASTMKEK
jgi:hypothetical protein